MAIGIDGHSVRRAAVKILHRVRSRQLLRSLIFSVSILVIVVILTRPASKSEIIAEVRVRTELEPVTYRRPETDLSLRSFEPPNEIIRMCKSRKLETLFFVHTAPDHLEDRQDLRKYLHRPPETAVVFMLGRTINESLAEQIAIESSIHEDLVVFDSFVDSYRNLTYKFTHSIRWIQKECAASETLRNIVKIDDDAWINMPLLKSYLNRGVPAEPQRIHCLIWRRVRTVRDSSSKWFVSKREYLYPYYPPYCGGLAYIIPKAVLEKLVEAIKKTHFFWIDDVYATGLLRAKAHIGLAQIQPYYAIRFNDTIADSGLPVNGNDLMLQVFNSIDVMFAHMKSPSLRKVRRMLFQTIDESHLNYTVIGRYTTEPRKAE